MYIDFIILLKILLFIAGIGALTYLALLFKNLFNITSEMKKTYIDNRESIDGSIEQLPEILKNVDKITENTADITGECNVLIKDIRSDVENIIGSTNLIMEDVSDITSTTNKAVSSVGEATEKVANSVSDLTNNVVDTTNSFVDSAGSILDYFFIAKDIIDEIRRYIKKK